MPELIGLLRGRRTLLAVLLGTLTVLSGVALLSVSGALITSAALQPESLLVLLPLITSVRLFAVSRAGFRYAERLASHDLSLRLVGRLRVLLLERLLPLTPAALVGARGGELLARIRTDVDQLQGLFVRLAGPAAVALLTGTVSVILAALVSPPLALVLAVLLMVLGAVVPPLALRAARHAAETAAAADTAFGADLLDLVRGLSDQLMADNAATALRQLEQQSERQATAEAAVARVAVVVTVLREAVPALGLLAALWFVGQGVARGDTPPVLLAAAALGSLGAFEAVAALGPAWATAGGIRSAGARVQGLAATQPAVTEPELPATLPSVSPLRLEGVGFRYPGRPGQPAVRDVTLTVGTGEKVALAGPSGAGKSTVLALALRFWDPDPGRVLVGGVDLRSLRLADVHSCFAWAAQTPQLLGGCVVGNLRLAAPAATEAALQHALEQVGLGHWQSEGRWQEWIGEAGQRLSAGERARVGLARALLSPAPCLLLDEPTAHLDRAAGRQLLAVLTELDRAVLLVTHSPGLLPPGWRVQTLPG